MEYKDYYKIMGIAKDASQDEVKRAYRKLARKYHPDVSTEKSSEERFKELGEAYEVLKDPEKRAAYDQLGANWKAGQSGFQAPPDWDSRSEFAGGSYTNGVHSDEYSDFFESLFGQHGRTQSYAGGAGSYQMRGEDIHAKVSINIEDAYHGSVRSLTLQNKVVDSNGNLLVRPRTLNVKIPKGVKSGQNIRLKGQGNAGINGGQAGDLFLEISFNQHAIYRVDGADVYMDLPIAPWEAALGGKIKLSTPSGTIDLKVPEAVSSGKKMRLKGRGIPAKKPGDFYVNLVIVLPEQLSEKEKSLYKELQQEGESFNPRVKLEWE